MSKKITNLIGLAAIAIFKQNDHLNEIFVTSDGQGFTSDEKAKDNARYLKDQDVQHFERGFKMSDKDIITEDNVEPGTKEDDLTERETLFIEYEELFGKKPSHNIGNEKLKNQISDKKAEETAKTNATQKTGEKVKANAPTDAKQTEDKKADEAAQKNAKQDPAKED